MGTERKARLPPTGSNQQCLARFGRKKKGIFIPWISSSGEGSCLSSTPSGFFLRPILQMKACLYGMESCSGVKGSVGVKN